MHIGFLTNEYPPLLYGGIGTSIRNLGRALVNHGHRVTVIGWGEKTEFEDQGVRVRFLQMTNFPKMGWLLNRFFVARELNRMVREEALDIVESPDWGGLSAGMKLICPLVIRCNGSDTFFGHLLGYRPRWSVYQAEKMALHGADGISAVSKFTAGETRKIFHTASPIEVIPNGVDLNQYPLEYGQLEEELILYFGTLVRKKGVLDLAKIFSKVVEKNPSAHLLLVGRDAIDRVTGMSTWGMMQKAMTDKAREQTRFIGPQPYSQMQQWISKAAVCVFPSHAEALPVSWLEAMACAKAVIASNIGWASEIIESGVSGILIHPTDLVPYANAINDLLDNAETRKLMGQRARERVERLFSIQRVAKLSIDWYRMVINAQR